MSESSHSCHFWQDRDGSKVTAMTTTLTTFAKSFAVRLHRHDPWPHGRPGADIRHDADLRRVLRDLDALP